MKGLTKTRVSSWPCQHPTGDLCPGRMITVKTLHTIDGNVRRERICDVCHYVIMTAELIVRRGQHRAGRGIDWRD